MYINKYVFYFNRSNIPTILKRATPINRIPFLFPSFIGKPRKRREWNRASNTLVIENQSTMLYTARLLMNSINRFPRGEWKEERWKGNRDDWINMGRR